MADTELISGQQKTKPGEILNAFSILETRVNPDPVWNFELDR